MAPSNALSATQRHAELLVCAITTPPGSETRGVDSPSSLVKFKKRKRKRHHLPAQLKALRMAAKDQAWTPFGSQGHRCVACSQSTWWAGPDGAAWHPECWLHREHSREPGVALKTATRNQQEQNKRLSKWWSNKQGESITKAIARMEKDYDSLPVADQVDKLVADAGKPEAVMLELGKRIRDARLINCWDLEQFAGMSKLDPDDVVRVEQGLGTEAQTQDCLLALGLETQAMGKNAAVTEARKKLGLTQKQVAEKAGVSQGVVYRVERGLNAEVSTDYRNRVLQVLGLDPVAPEPAVASEPTQEQNATHPEPPVPTSTQAVPSEPSDPPRYEAQPPLPPKRVAQEKKDSAGVWSVTRVVVPAPLDSASFAEAALIGILVSEFKNQMSLQHILGLAAQLKTHAADLARAFHALAKEPVIHEDHHVMNLDDVNMIGIPDDKKTAS